MTNRFSIAGTLRSEFSICDGRPDIPVMKRRESASTFINGVAAELYSFYPVSLSASVIDDTTARI